MLYVRPAGSRIARLWPLLFWKNNVNKNNNGIEVLDLNSISYDIFLKKILLVLVMALVTWCPLFCFLFPIHSHP